MSQGTRSSLPVFPLANVVLFPKLRVPLYIFEPRYRQMTADALAGDRRIGMVTVKPEHLEETAGNPPVFAIGCEGVIAHSESLPDGGYNIVLLGSQRFRIHAEQSPQGERLYRVAEVEMLSDPAGDPASRERTGGQERAPQLRSTIIRLLRELLQRSQPESETSKINDELFAGYDDELFVNSLAQSVNFSAIEKQGLIECDSVFDRLAQLLALLEFRIAGLRSGQSGTTPVQ